MIIWRGAREYAVIHKIHFPILTLRQVLVFKDKEKVSQNSLVTEIKPEDPFIIRKATASRANVPGPSVLGDRSTNYSMKSSTTPQYGPGPICLFPSVKPSLGASGPVKREQSQTAAAPLPPTRVMHGITTPEVTPTKVSRFPSQQATRATDARPSTIESLNTSSAPSERQSQLAEAANSRAELKLTTQQVEILPSPDVTPTRASTARSQPAPAMVGVRSSTKASLDNPVTVKHQVQVSEILQVQKCSEAELQNAQTSALKKYEGQHRKIKTAKGKLSAATKTGFKFGFGPESGNTKSWPFDLATDYSFTEGGTSFKFGSGVSRPTQSDSIPEIQAPVTGQQNHAPISIANEAFNFPLPQSSTITTTSLPSANDIVANKVIESEQEGKLSGFSFGFLPKTKVEVVEAEVASTPSLQKSRFTFQSKSEDSLSTSPLTEVTRKPLKEKPIARLAVTDIDAQDLSTDLDQVESKENTMSGTVSTEASLEVVKESEPTTAFSGPALEDIDLPGESIFEDREDVGQAVKKTQVELAEPTSKVEQDKGVVSVITPEVEDKENIPPITPKMVKQEPTPTIIPTRSSSLPKMHLDSAPITLTQRPTTPEKVEDSDYGYGYAVITPPKRYSAYLPTVAKHGLYTPPTTPEKFEGCLKARYSPSPNSVLARPRYSSSPVIPDIVLAQPPRTPSPAVSEAALLRPQETEPFPDLEQEGEDGVTEVDEMCNCGRPKTRCVHVDVGVQTELAAGYDAYMEIASQNFEDAGIEVDTKKSGCLAGFGLGKLKEKIRERKAKKGEKAGKAEKVKLSMRGGDFDRWRDCAGLVLC